MKIDDYKYQSLIKFFYDYIKNNYNHECTWPFYVFYKNISVAKIEKNDLIIITQPQLFLKMMDKCKLTNYADIRLYPTYKF